MRVSRQFVGDGDDHLVAWRSQCQLARPPAESSCVVLHDQQHGPSAVDEHASQIDAAAFADAEQPCLASVECWRGIRPSQAANSRPLWKAAPLPMAATVAVETSGPMPGIWR